jgi:undecaprenyl diphosphate synthase
MQWAMESTAKNSGTTLTLALNYGARSEMVDAVRRILTDLTTEAHSRGCSVEDLLGAGALDSLDESTISRALYTADMPDPDLVIRTSGEQRISNFLLWQLAYAEIFITDRLWPDFRGLHLLEALVDYQRRDRRFGGLNDNSDEKIDSLQPVAELENEIANELVPPRELSRR